MSHAGLIVISNSKIETELIIGHLLDTGMIDSYINSNDSYFNKNNWNAMIKKDGNNTYFSKCDKIDWIKTINDSDVCFIASKDTYYDLNEDMNFEIPSGKYAEFFDVHI